MKKTIFFLDQNYVSNLAKAHYLSNWKDPNKNFYQELNNLLLELTINDKIICPTSPLHREETELGNRVKEFLWHFVEELGYGLSFKHSIEIMKCQVIESAKAYSGQSNIEYSTWKIAFNHDPQIPIKLLSRPNILVNFPNTQEYNDYLRLSKNSVINEYSTYKKICIGKRHTFISELEAQKKQLVYEIFNPRPKLNVKQSKLEQSIEILGLTGLNEFYRSIIEIIKNSKRTENFFDSPQLLDCPYIHIYASLMAADIFFHPDTKPAASLFLDFEIIASVMPYVDIIATDSYISQLISNANLLNRFGCKVYSMKQRKELMEILRKL